MNVLKKALPYICMVLFGAGPAVAGLPHSESIAKVTGVITASAVAGSENSPRITAFDVSPDGGSLALLYDTWPSRSKFALSVAVWDIESNTLSARNRLGDHALLIPPAPILHEAVLFVDEQKYIVAMGLGKVWIVEAKTCSVIRQLETSFPNPSPPVELLHAGSSKIAVIYKQGRNQFRVSLFEIPSGKLLASWASSAFPQSFSPNGKLVVGPIGDYNAGAVTNLQLIDSQTGNTIRMLRTGFAFNNPWPEEHGSVVARFLDNQNIVVCPDNMVDHNGRHSGNSLEIINVSEGRIVRVIAPKEFGPSGELAVSPDGSHFAVYSLYVSARVQRADGLLPNPYKPELLVFDSKGSEPDYVVPRLDAGGGVAPLTNQVLPCLSSGASVIALAQDGAIDFAILNWPTLRF